MRAPHSIRDVRLAATAAGVAALAVTCSAFAQGTAPAPCGGIPQITDPTGDGHHTTTDVTAGWFSEAAGRLQAVIKVRAGNWRPDHDDSDAAEFAMLFRTGGQIRYVRAVAPRTGSPTYDYGTWTAAGGFVSVGATNGSLVSGAGGTATIDVPAATGATTGTVLEDPFVLTWDGYEGTEPHWVDRGPGGNTPAGTEFGADYVVGSCGGPGNPGGGGGVSAVALKAPAKRVGAGRVRVTGRVAPARAGIPVTLVKRVRGSSASRRLTTAADGTFSTRVSLKEKSRLRASAGGLDSQTLTIRMLSKTRIKIRRRPGGGALVKGRVNPALPGRAPRSCSAETRSGRAQGPGLARRGSSSA